MGFPLLRNKPSHKSIKQSLGGKASVLLQLMDAKMPVPEFITIEHTQLKKAFPTPPFKQNKELSDEQLKYLAEELQSGILHNAPPQNFINSVHARVDAAIGQMPLYAVRSSGALEDGTKTSFAGIFTSLLHVEILQLPKAIQTCYASSFSAHALKYMMLNNGHLLEPHMSVIIQKMVPAAISGVLFTVDIHGNMQNMVVSSAPGFVEGIVNGTAETDTYWINRNTAEYSQKLMNQRTDFEAHADTQSGTLNRNQLEQLRLYALQIETILSAAADIEFSIDEDGNIFILQARPITTLNLADLKILDNTNISESFPGITLPLTYSFARQSYYHVFDGLARGLKVPNRVIENMQPVFMQLIQHHQGHIYYRLDNWLKMMPLVLPGKKGLAIWQKSVGLSTHGLHLAAQPLLMRLQVLWRIVRFMLMYKILAKKFFAFTNSALKTMSEAGAKLQSPNQILTHYKAYSAKLFEFWYPTLINDLVAFVAFDKMSKLLLQSKKCTNQNLPNDLLCGLRQAESERPLRMLLEMKDIILADRKLHGFFTDNTPTIIYQRLNEDECPQISTLIHEYLQLYSNRTLDELKLENSGFDVNTEGLIAIIQNILAAPITLKSLQDNQEKVRATAAAEAAVIFKNRPLSKLFFSFWMHHAQAAIANRENMRLCRARAFGEVKKLFAQIGKHMHTDGLIQQADDVFYLDMPQLVDFCLGKSTENLGAMVASRKKQYGEFRKTSPPNRIMFQHNPPEAIEEQQENLEIKNQLVGTAVSAGIVRAEALVVHQPNAATEVKGRILVTKTTDPGWIFLMAQSAGIICEKGSLLSHAAIVSRELGIPTVVGVSHATRLIKSGSWITLNGSTGKIDLETTTE